MMSVERPRYPPLLIDENTELCPSRAVWKFVIAIVLAKLTLMIAVLTVDFSWTTALLLFITTWFWVIAGAVLLVGPITFAYRLRRVRSRRKSLQASEWMEDDTESTRGSATRQR